jgi:predicted TIM-barrel fold metal-dependent hydrolase
VDIVDFHTHLWPVGKTSGDHHAPPGISIPEDALRRGKHPDLLLEEFKAADVSLAVVSTTIESLFGIAKPTDANLIREVNDWLAALVTRYPDRLVALGTVDAFSGEAAAHEAERAITELNFRGLVIDSSRHGLFLGDECVRPTLDVAAHHGVPIFVHPVGIPDASIFVAGAGRLGNSAGRGLMNGVAFLSVLENGILDRYPDLSFVFATLGLGAIVQAARGGVFGKDRRSSGTRPNLYFDTMGEDPAIVKILVDFFGAERVVAGTDWPLLPPLSQDGLTSALAHAGLAPSDAALVAGGNARRLLRLPLVG